MTDTKEVEESNKDKTELTENNPASKSFELHKLHMKEFDKKQEMERGEFEEEDEEEEEEEDEEEEEEEEEEVEEEEEEEEEDEEEEESEEDEQEKKVEPRLEDVSNDGRRELDAEVSLRKNSDGNMDSQGAVVENNKKGLTGNAVPSGGNDVMSKEVHVENICNNNDADVPIPDSSLKSDVGTDEKPSVNDEKGSLRPETEAGNGVKLDAYDSPNCRSVDADVGSHARSSSLKEQEGELNNEARTKEETVDEENRDPSDSLIFDTDTSGGGESGTEDEQAAFMHELEKFHKEKYLEFKPPKFYGEPLNLLKLWRAVLKLGGYDKVTTCKYWRQVGESFKPPKTCTTVSWTFRIFYEKALLEYERHRIIGGGTSISASLSVPMSVENQAPGSGRARRDAAARAMQGWHSQRILDNGEVSDPIIKDKNSVSVNKKEKQLKNLGVLKRKKPSSTDAAVKPARTKEPKTQSETTVIDIGTPADWVKINVRVTKDCYEVYALVPGLLREEVRVQSDPAGRLVISGEPENPDNPWNVTPFKKVVSLPSRIDPHQTSAVVTLHGQLFVRVPFEQYD